MAAETFGTYELIEEIGQGGGGRVYKARQAGLERIVALKVFAGAPGNQEHRLRFQREAKVLSALSHAHIVKMYDSGFVGDQAYFAMELVDGASLAREIEIGAPLAVDRVIVLAREILDALTYIHAQGLVHRDLKPSNILISRDGRSRLSDFGLVSAPSVTRLTRVDEILGTPRYIPPECFNAQKHGPRGDLWQLGAVLFEMLTARTAVDGDTMAEIIQTTRTFVAPHPVAVNPGVPAHLDDMVHRLLSGRPHDRYAGATEALQALSATSPRAGTSGHRATTAPGAGRPPSGTRASPTPTPPVARGSTVLATWPWHTHLAAFAIGVVLTAVAHLWSDTRPAPPALSPETGAASSATGTPAGLRPSAATWPTTSVELVLGLSQIEFRWIDPRPGVGHVSISKGEHLAPLARFDESLPAALHTIRMSSEHWPLDAPLVALVRTNAVDRAALRFHVPSVQPSLALASRSGHDARLRLIPPPGMTLDFDEASPPEIRELMSSVLLTMFRRASPTARVDRDSQEGVAVLSAGQLSREGEYSVSAVARDRLGATMAVQSIIPRWDAAYLEVSLENAWTATHPPGLPDALAAAIKALARLDQTPRKVAHPVLGTFENRLALAERGELDDVNACLADDSTAPSKRLEVFGTLQPWLALESAASLLGDAGTWAISALLSGRSGTVSRQDFLNFSVPWGAVQERITQFAHWNAETITPAQAMDYACALPPDAPTIRQHSGDALALFNVTAAGPARTRRPCILCFAPGGVRGTSEDSSAQASVTSGKGSSANPPTESMQTPLLKPSLRLDRSASLEGLIRKSSHVEISIITGQSDPQAFVLCAVGGSFVYLLPSIGNAPSNAPYQVLGATLPAAVLQSGTRGLSAPLIGFLPWRLGWTLDSWLSGTSSGIPTDNVSQAAIPVYLVMLFFT